MVAQKNNRKRPAPSKLESKPKRRSAEPESAEKKRSRPVTHTFLIVEESDSDDVDEDENVDVAADDEPLIDDDAMEVEAETNPPKDPNGTLLSQYTGISNNQYIKPPENPTKPKSCCSTSERLPNRIQPCSTMPNECGHSPGSKISRVHNVRNTSRIS